MKNFLSKVYKRRGKCKLALENLDSEWVLHFLNYFLLSVILIFSIVNLCGFLIILRAILKMVGEGALLRSTWKASPDDSISIWIFLYQYYLKEIEFFKKIILESFLALEENSSQDDCSHCI